MIEFRDVVVAFGSHVVLNGLSFKAGFDEKVAILGRSGSGKTTMLRLILGLLRPDEGNILIDGKEITGMPESRLRDIRHKFSVVFQEGALFDSLDVKENVAYYLREYSSLSEKELEEKIRSLLTKLEIENAIYLMPEELSGGMQRRVAIARALISYTSRMMLYDEPTTGLDPLTADDICNLINELSAGTPSGRQGLIIVTHKVVDAAKIAERFLYLRDTIVFDGSLEELKATEDPQIRKFVNELICLPDK